MFCFIYFFSLCLDDRLKKYAQERKDLLDEVSKLKFELEEERIRSSGQCYNLMNGSDNEDFEDSSSYFKNLSLIKPYRSRTNLSIFQKRRLD